MRLKNNLYTAMLGVAALFVSSSAAAVETKDNLICKEIAKLNLGAPGNGEIYLGVLARFQKTDPKNKKDIKGEANCVPPADHKDGNCFSGKNGNIFSVIDPELYHPYDAYAIGYSRVGGKPVTFSGFAGGGGHEAGFKMDYALCANGASIVPLLKEAEHPNELGGYNVCWDVNNTAKSFLYGPQLEYSIPQHLRKKNKYAGFGATPASSESGGHTYSIAFKGLVKVKQSCDSEPIKLVTGL